jgi:hypothetical protein
MDSAINPRIACTTMFQYNNSFVVWMSLLVMMRLLEKNSVISAIISFRRHVSPLEVPVTCLDGTVGPNDSSSSSGGGGGGGVALILDGSCRIVSEPMPSDVTKRELATFLQQPNVRDLFFSAGGTRPVQQYQMTRDVETLWRHVVQCKYFTCPPPLSSSSISSRSLLLPQPGDAVMSFDSVVRMFGLTITTTALNGIKAFHRHSHSHRHDKDDDSSPIYYMAVGVAERQDVLGSQPMVWLYHQVTGLHKKTTGVFYPTPARACSKISITTTTSCTTRGNDSHGQDGDVDKRLLALEYDVQLKIIVHVPHVLVRLLPASKATMERQGSAAIVKALSKDIEMTLGRVRQQFLLQRRRT